MEQLTESDETSELRPIEKHRLARLMIRLVGAAASPPGSFMRSYIWHLDQQLKAGVVADKNETAERAKSAAEVYLRGGVTLAQVCQNFGVTERTLSRNIRRLRAQEGNQHDVHP